MRCFKGGRLVEFIDTFLVDPPVLFFCISYIWLVHVFKSIHIIKLLDSGGEYIFAVVVLVIWLRKANKCKLFRRMVHEEKLKYLSTFECVIFNFADKA